MSQNKRKPLPCKKDCRSDLLLNSRALALFCLLNKPSTHKHTVWSGKSSLTLVKEVTSRAEMAACHFPCQGDICHSLLSCFFLGKMNLHLSRADSLPPSLYLCSISFFQKHLWFSFCFWSPSFRRDENSTLRSFYFFSKILVLFLFSYNKNLVYCIYHSICLSKKRTWEKF